MASRRVWRLHLRSPLLLGVWFKTRLCRRADKFIRDHIHIRIDSFAIYTTKKPKRGDKFTIHILLFTTAIITVLSFQKKSNAMVVR